MTMLDVHGQPLNLRWNAARRADRTLDEMLGLVKGVIVDGVVTEGEAQFLAHWINANPEAARIWPGNVLARRLQKIFADRVVDEEERDDLLGLLQSVTGETLGMPENENPSTRLPLDDPAPALSFDGTLYVFTGRFVYGTRAACQASVVERGGECASDITRKTDVVVIGDLGSRDWIHTSFGRKIQKAVEYRDHGVGLAIVSEEHWAGQLN